jgi:muconolactone delta-isomerase
MKKFMADILLEGIDNETRMKLLPREQELVKEMEENGTILSSYIKADVSGIYIVMQGEDAANIDAMLSTLPYYPYMKISLTALR